MGRFFTLFGPAGQVNCRQGHFRLQLCLYKCWVIHYIIDNNPLRTKKQESKQVEKNLPAKSVLSLRKEILPLALPIMFQQGLAMLMAFIDNVMVGQLDALAMAGVAVVNKYFMIANSVLYGMTSGFGIFIAQYTGAGEREKGQAVFMFNLVSALCLGCLFALVLLVFPGPILALFVKDTRTIQAGMSYLAYFSYSYIFYATGVVFFSSFQSIGRTWLPMLAGCVAVVLNTFINYLLIFGKWGLPAMGTRGAGLAALLARSLEVLIYLLFVLVGDNYFKIKLALFGKLSRQVLGLIGRKCLSLMAMEFSWAVGTVALFWFFCQVDESAVASLAITETTYNMNFIIYGGAGVAVPVFVGALLGSGRFDQAKKNARRILLLVFAGTAIFGLLVIIFAGKIPLLFQISGPERNLATKMLRINAIFYGFVSLNVVIYYILRIGGDVKASFVMETGYVWLFLLPVAALLALVSKVDILTFYVLVQATELVKLFLGRHYIKKERWVRNLT